MVGMKCCSFNTEPITDGQPAESPRPPRPLPSTNNNITVHVSGEKKGAGTEKVKRGQHSAKELKMGKKTAFSSTDTWQDQWQRAGVGLGD